MSDKRAWYVLNRALSGGPAEPGGPAGTECGRSLVAVLASGRDAASVRGAPGGANTSLDRAHPAASLAPAAWPENRAGPGAAGVARPLVAARLPGRARQAALRGKQVAGLSLEAYGGHKDASAA